MFVADPARDPGPLRFEGLTLDVGARTLLDGGGREIKLRRSEFELLLAFVAAPGRALSRDHLLEAVAGRHSDPYDRSIDVLVSRLRRKIEAEASGPRLILTVPGMGYRFCAEPHRISATTGAASEAHAPVLPTLPLSPERRQVTILQCALSGAAFLSAQRDPEDLQVLLGAFHARAAEIVTRAGGTIARLLSDGVLAYFGYPKADEHEAECAVRAALCLIDAAGRTSVETPQTRTGVATGLVVVGGQAGGASGAPAVLGEAPSLAAALMAHAGPDTVMISASTRRLAGGFFECREHAPISFEGAAEPVPAWEVVGEGGTDSRFEALRGRDVSALFGREEEMALLLRRWEQAKAGAGKVVLVTGEPGIGKSHLARALQERLAGDAHLLLRFFCSPHRQDSALYPFITQLERVAGFLRTDTPEAKIAKLEARLAQSDTSEEAVAVIAGLLSIPAGGRYCLPEMSPQRLREKTLEAMFARFSGLAARHKLLVIYEDAHWIDPSSLELLARSVAYAASVPVLMLITARPEFRPPWPDQAHVTMLPLNRLSTQDAAALVACAADGRALPEPAVQQILDHAEGVPLFVEELTKAVLEGGGGAGQDTILTSLRDSLEARLDRIGPAREIAQIGAVIGREFTHELLSDVAAQPDGSLEPLLARLIGSGLVFCSGAAPDARYSFKHVLVQQAAYESLLRSRRAALHARIVDALLRRDPTIEDTQPNLLAWHCEQGGLTEKAAILYARAGWRSTRRGAFAEGREQFDNALRLIAKLPHGEPRDRTELETLARFCATIRSQRGHASSEAARAYARAADLWERFARPAEFLDVVRGQWLLFHYRSDVRRARELAERLLLSSQKQDDPRHHIVGRLLVGGTAMVSGEMLLAKTHLCEAQGLIQSGSDDPSLLWQSQSAMPAWIPWASANAYLGNVNCWLGYPEQGLAHLSAVAKRAPTMDYACAVAEWAIFQARARSFVFDAGELEQTVTGLSRVTRAYGLPLLEAQATILQGYVIACSEDAQKGIVVMREGLRAYAATDTVLWSGYHTALLAEAYQRINHLQEARGLLLGAQQLAVRTGERWYDAELARRLGEVARQEGNVSAAERHFIRAIAIARRQRAMLWELHAATSLARLLSDQNRAAEAYLVLAPIYDWFTEGFETASLRRAKALLGEVDGARVAERASPAIA